MAKIGIDLDRKIGTVDRRIFGNFVEYTFPAHSVTLLRLELA